MSSPQLMILDTALVMDVAAASIVMEIVRKKQFNLALRIFLFFFFLYISVFSAFCFVSLMGMSLFGSKACS